MRAVVLLVVLAGCGRYGFDPSIGADAPPPDPSLVAWYTMDGLAGTTLFDQSGFGHDGMCTPPACPTVDVGIIDRALRFDGVDDLIQIHANATLDPPGTITVAAWFETDVEGSLNQFWCFANLPIGSADDDSWQLCVQGNQLYVGVRYGAPNADSIELSGASFAANTWHHAAFTFDGTTYQAYLDGGLGNGGHAPMPLVYDGSAMLLGADLDGPTLTAPFQGRIDDVRIYNRALSVAEIATLASPPP